MLYCHQWPQTEAQRSCNLIPSASLLRVTRLHANKSSSRADVPHVEVDHVLGVGALHRDCEGFEGVEGEGDQAPHGVIYRPSQQSGLDLELQQAGVPRVKPGGGWRENSGVKSFIQSSLLEK